MRSTRLRQVIPVVTPGARYKIGEKAATQGHFSKLGRGFGDFWGWQMAGQAGGVGLAGSCGVHMWVPGAAAPCVWGRRV